MKRNKGFTLLEVLFVLSIWSILIFLSIPLLLTTITHHEEKQFLKTLKSDVLLIQTKSYGTKSKNSFIEFNKNHYVIYDIEDNYKRTKRNYPTGWQSDGRSFKQISFKNGSIREAGVILLQDKDTDYKITFPPGKGRGYVDKQ